MAILEMETVVIALGASLSGAATMEGRALAGIVMPAAWNAADLTFQASHDGTTYNNLYDAAGTEVTVTASTSRFIQIATERYAGPLFLKVRSGTAGAAVVQTAARNVILIFREI